MPQQPLNRHLQKTLSLTLGLPEGAVGSTMRLLQESSRDLSLPTFNGQAAVLVRSARCLLALVDRATNSSLALKADRMREPETRTSNARVAHRVLMNSVLTTRGPDVADASCSPPLLDMVRRGRVLMELLHDLLGAGLAPQRVESLFASLSPSYADDLISGHLKGTLLFNVRDEEVTFSIIRGNTIVLSAVFEWPGKASRPRPQGRPLRSLETLARIDLLMLIAIGRAALGLQPFTDPRAVGEPDGHTGDHEPLPSTPAESPSAPSQGNETADA